MPVIKTTKESSGIFDFECEIQDTGGGRPATTTKRFLGSRGMSITPEMVQEAHDVLKRHTRPDLRLPRGFEDDLFRLLGIVRPNDWGKRSSLFLDVLSLVSETIRHWKEAVEAIENGDAEAALYYARESGVLLCRLNVTASEPAAKRGKKSMAGSDNANKVNRIRREQEAQERAEKEKQIKAAWFEEYERRKQFGEPVELPDIDDFIGEAFDCKRRKIQGIRGAVGSPKKRPSKASRKILK